MNSYTREELYMLSRMDMKDTGVLHKTMYDSMIIEEKKIVLDPELFKKNLYRDKAIGYGTTGRSLYDMAYEMPLEKMPLYINERPGGSIARWRLKVGR